MTTIKTTLSTALLGAGLAVVLLPVQRTPTVVEPHSRAPAGRKGSGAAHAATTSRGSTVPTANDTWPGNPVVWMRTKFSTVRWICARSWRSAAASRVSRSTCSPRSPSA